MKITERFRQFWNPADRDIVDRARKSTRLARRFGRPFLIFGATVIGFVAFSVIWILLMATAGSAEQQTATAGELTVGLVIGIACGAFVGFIVAFYSLLISVIIEQGKRDELLVSTWDRLKTLECEEPNLDSAK